MRITILFLLLSITQSLLAQDVAAYVQTALDNNLNLKAQGLDYQIAAARLAQAKALYWPQLSIQGRFSAAQGGRAIEIPAGDLVNPAYSNLNVLNSYNRANDINYPNIPVYPVVNNEAINFLRATEQETVIRLEMPLYNRKITHNQRAQEQLIAASSAGIDAFREQLIKDVQQAYYTYAQTYYAREIYEDALALVTENLRTTESLRTHHKATAADVYTVQAQVASVRQSLALAKQQEQTAGAYFNTLLNRDHTTPIVLSAVEEVDPTTVMSLEKAQQQARAQRKELQQLDHYLGAAAQQREIARDEGRPTLNLRADYGIQGTTYSFGADDDFFLGSLVFQVPIFNKTTSTKVQEAELQQQQLQLQRSAATQQIELQVLQQYYALQTAQEQVALAQAQEEAASEAFRLQNRLYEQGQSNLVAFTDARTNWTSARQQLIIARYGYLIREAEWQWASASLSPHASAQPGN